MATRSKKRRTTRKRAERKLKARAADLEKKARKSAAGQEPTETPGVGAVARQENAIVAQALAADRKVWPLEDKHKEVAVGITIRNMASEDAKVSNAAVRNMIAMVGQNIGAEDDRPPGGNINIQIIAIEAVKPQQAEPCPTSAK